jgi:hypothetical protein
LCGVDPTVVSAGGFDAGRTGSHPPALFSDMAEHPP